MTTTTHALLLVSLGPVQDFIASARRCQDLWFGSFLLSELSRVTAAAISHAAGSRALIFPRTIEVDGDDKPGVANKILAELDSVSSARRIADGARSAMLTALRNLAERAFRDLDPEGRRRADSQIAELMEYAWVAVPYAGAEGYARAREQAERLLAAQKNTRVWGPVPQASSGPVPKCSIDGVRESIIDASARRADLHVKKIEQLCGVCLLKRKGAELDDFGRARRPSFHSTSHVASAPTRTRFARGSLRAQRSLDKYVGELEDQGLSNMNSIAGGDGADLTWSWGARDPRARVTVGHALVAGGRSLDGELLYEDRLPDLFEQDSGARSVRAARAALQNALGGRTPPPYYAFLQADGDGMGAAIESITTKNGHQKLGDALDKFSQACRAIVEGHAGSLVYAGGDDVLALLPLHTALGCADELRKGFVEHLRQVLPDKTPTLSVGLGIAHHLSELGDARALAKKAEVLAKAHDGKNALGIVVGKRGGAPIEAVGSWAEEPTPLRQRLEEIVRRLHAGDLSSKAAHDLEEAIAPLVAFETPKDITGVVTSLARRVLDRKRRSGGEVTITDETRVWLEGRIHRDDPLASVRALSNELQIAAALLPAYETAWGELGEEEAP